MNTFNLCFEKVFEIKHYCADIFLKLFIEKLYYNLSS